MEKQGRSEMEIIPSESHSYIKLLKVNREHLVTHVRNTQCLLDNLLQNDYFSAEDVEIVCACPTQPDKVPVTGMPALVAGRGFSPLNWVKSFGSSVHWVEFPVGVIYRTEMLELAYSTVTYFTSVFLKHSKLF